METQFFVLYLYNDSCKMDIVHVTSSFLNKYFKDILPKGPQKKNYLFKTERLLYAPFL
jgi:hypothetical protein